jgi:hypothetical protein
MPFDWKQYLDLAQFLLAQAGVGTAIESAQRGCVSKAYYAAFNYARQYATNYLGFIASTKPEDRSQDHGRLRAHLIKRRRRRVADTLNGLRNLRNDCKRRRSLGDGPCPYGGGCNCRCCLCHPEPGAAPWAMNAPGLRKSVVTGSKPEVLARKANTRQ